MKVLVVSAVVGLAAFTALHHTVARTGVEGSHDRLLTEMPVAATPSTATAAHHAASRTEPITTAAQVPAPVPAQVRRHVEEQVVAPLEARRFITVFEETPAFSRVMRSSQVEVPFDITYQLQSNTLDGLVSGTLRLSSPTGPTLRYSLRVNTDGTVEIRDGDRWVLAAIWLQHFSPDALLLPGADLAA